VFVLSYDAGAGYPFRVAGTRVCALLGCDLKDRSFSALFDAQSRREIEDIRHTVAKLKTEAAVRRTVEDLNERIRRAQRGHLDGPPVVLSTVDADEVVEAWLGLR